MRPYNVEVFGREFNLIAHTTVDESALEIDFDYLTPNESTVQVRLTGFYNAFSAEEEGISSSSSSSGGISAMGSATTSSNGDWDIYMNELGIGCYIRIARDSEEYFGIITSCDAGDDALLTKIGFKPFIAAVFDTDILLDTDYQGGLSLEETLQNVIYNNFISNSSDSLMDIAGLSCPTPTSSTSWGMNLKSDTEDMHQCIINFYDVLIRRAMAEYGIAIQTTVDIESQSITLNIGTVSATKTIELDLPNVIEKTLLINEADKNVNVLQVYDTASYVTTRLYYKHSDGTYDTTNSDRIYPPVRELSSTTADDAHTFVANADSVAASVFGEVTYNNLIEVTCLFDDSLIEPTTIETGTVVSIISSGISYASILTGYKLTNNVITLIFGSIRADLTKLIGRE